MEKRHKILNRNKKYWGKNKGAKYTWKIQVFGNTGKSPKVDTKGIYMRMWIWSMRIKNLISHKRKHRLSKLGKWWPSALLKCSVQNDTVNFNLCLFLIWWEFPFQHFQSVLLLLWVLPNWRKKDMKKNISKAWNRNKLYPKLVAFADNGDFGCYQILFLKL